MMYAAVKFVSDELNSYLTGNLQPESDAVLLGCIQEPDGSMSPNITDKMVISLINIERTAVQGRAPVSVNSSGDLANNHSSPLYLNLFLLVSASFTNYAQALRYLSSTAAFVQFRNEMTRDSCGSNTVLVTISATRETIAKASRQISTLTNQKDRNNG